MDVVFMTLTTHYLYKILTGEESICSGHKVITKISYFRRTRTFMY